MHKELDRQHIDILAGSPSVNQEFSEKIRELDRRLKVNGMSYNDWETLNDRQHDIFSHDMFLDGECATSVKHYVMGAVDSCWCPDVVEDLHHHSPVLMREIEKQQEMLPDMKVKIGESLNNLNETIDLLLENIMGEDLIQEGDTAEIDINEIWLAYSIAGNSWDKFRSGGPFGNPQTAYEERVAEISGTQGERGMAAIEIQKGRAEATAKEVLSWAKANNFPDAIEFVAWTARPGALDTAYGAETGDNPTDVLIKFVTPPGEPESFLGVSAKSTKQSTGKVAFLNTGGNYISKIPFPKGLADVGGAEAFEAIKKKYTELLDEVMANSVKNLQKYNIEAPQGQGKRNGFLKQLRKTFATPEEIELQSAKRKPPSWLAAEAFQVPMPTAPEQPEGDNPEVGPTPEQMAAYEKEMASFNKEQKKQQELQKKLVATTEEVLKDFYGKGAEFLTFYRDAYLAVLEGLNAEQLQQHVLMGIMRTDALPVCVVATGRGKSAPFTADVVENPSDPDWVKDASANGFALEKTGGLGPGVGFKTGGPEGVKIVKIRMKFATRPFASSVKPTAEGW